MLKQLCWKRLKFLKPDWYFIIFENKIKKVSLIDQLFGILPNEYGKLYYNKFQQEGFQDKDVFEAYLDQNEIVGLIDNAAHAQTIYIFMKKIGEQNNLKFDGWKFLKDKKWMETVNNVLYSRTKKKYGKIHNLMMPKSTNF